MVCRCVGLSIYEILFGPRTSSNIDLLGPVAEAPADGFPPFKPDKNMQGPCLPSPAVLPNAGQELPHETANWGAPHNDPEKKLSCNQIIEPSQGSAKKKLNANGIQHDCRSGLMGGAGGYCKRKKLRKNQNNAKTRKKTTTSSTTLGITEWTLMRWWWISMGISGTAFLVSLNHDWQSPALPSRRDMTPCQCCTHKLVCTIKMWKKINPGDKS